MKTRLAGQKDNVSDQRVDFAQLALMEDEYQRLLADGGEVELKGWKKVVDDFFVRAENRPKKRVKKSTYILLTILTGLVGGHRFYEGRYKLGLLYLALAITGLTIGLSVVDLLIVIPMKTDDENYIRI